MSDPLPRSVVCTLVETAVAAITNLNAAPEVLPDLRQFRIERVHCATVSQQAYRDDLTGAIEMAIWTIELESDEQPDVIVGINRRTGEARAYKAPNEFDFTAVDLCE
jgi:hypothetical protein